MINEHVKSWLGYNVELFDADAAKKGVRDYKSTIYRIATDYDAEMTEAELLDSFLSNPKSAETPALIIGAFFGDSSELSSEEIVAKLVAAAPKLPNLKAIFLGDILSEENEISWINQSDVSPLFEAYPKLEHFRVRGANGLGFERVNSTALKTLVVESGGMSSALLAEIAVCELPNLEHLELWLGTDNYGFDGSLDDIMPFLDKSRYPNLRYLGLKNSDIENEIAGAVIRSEILGQLEVLDLSLGVLTDEGGEALASCDELKSLEKLDLSYHYLSADMEAHLQAKFPNADLSDRQEPDRYGDETYRNVAVGE